MATHYLDALVVGCGFGGIYQVKKLVDQGMNVKAIDAAGDVGGTWYWNRYPGAMSDTESYLYRYSWDLEDLMSYHWSTHYIKQHEVLAYLEHVVKRYNLREHMQFKTELTSAQWNELEARWIVETSTGETFKPRYLITALGLLSKQNFPNIPGLKTFKGDLCHTGNWPASCSVEGKRVGVIGNGSTGTQVITAIAKDVKKLLCFQRSPQYSVPSGNGPVSLDYRKSINERYPEIWKQAKESMFAFGFEESKRQIMSVSEEEREQIFEDAWQRGNGFRFMFWTFCDISYDEAANAVAADFIRRKIQSTVKDPEKARKLTPTDYYARRPLCDNGYYQQFNRDNVDVVDLKATPITEITANGIRTSDGTEYELDIIIFATGFDAVDGNYTRVAIKGRSGGSLKEHWTSVGPTSYLGISVPDFPNLFMILGPNGPFTNLPPTIETDVEFISDTIAKAEEVLNSQRKLSNGTSAPNGHAQGQVVSGHSSHCSPPHPVIEATPEAEEQWTELCDQLSANSLFRKTDSWIFGANVAGKKPAVMFYFGGLGKYRKILKEVVEDGYRGYKPFF